MTKKTLIILVGLLMIFSAKEALAESYTEKLAARSERSTLSDVKSSAMEIEIQLNHELNYDEKDGNTNTSLPVIDVSGNADAETAPLADPGDALTVVPGDDIKPELDEEEKERIPDKEGKETVAQRVAP